ncbi:MAG: hypothetical protein GY756_10075 [bacterium]|nr:hypothetical protein [bacterium]
MRNILLILIIVSFTQQSNAQKTKNSKFSESQVSLFETTKDLLNKMKIDADLVAVLYNKSEKYLSVRDIVDNKSGKIKKFGKDAWALKCDGEYFFNLLYLSADYLTEQRIFLKLDIIGKYCAIFLDKDTSINKITGHYDPTQYYSGIFWMLYRGSQNWNKCYIDKTGNKKKILFIDTNKIRSSIRSGNANCSSGYLLNRKELKKIASDNPELLKKIKNKEITFEEVVEFIKSLNEK